MVVVRFSAGGSIAGSSVQGAKLPMVEGPGPPSGGEVLPPVPGVPPSSDGALPPVPPGLPAEPPLPEGLVPPVLVLPPPLPEGLLVPPLPPLPLAPPLPGLPPLLLLPGLPPLLAGGVGSDVPPPPQEANKKVKSTAPAWGVPRSWRNRVGPFFEVMRAPLGRPSTAGPVKLSWHPAADATRISMTHPGDRTPRR
jgi:hypothetical protein